MAEAAIDTQAGDVVLVTERHRLLGTDTFTRDPGRALQLISCKTECAYRDDQKDDTGACVIVSTRWKEWRHLTVYPVPTEISQSTG